MSRPWRVVLRVGNDFVASDTHYVDKEGGDAARKQLLNSETFKGLDQRKYGVRVMHVSTFTKICKEGAGVTMARLKQNEKVYGKKVSNASSLFRDMTDLYKKLEAEYS